MKTMIIKMLDKIMSKQFKRQSRQTGMTDDRMKGFEKIRALKKSGKHRLDQVIKVRYN